VTGERRVLLAAYACGVWVLAVTIGGAGLLTAFRLPLWGNLAVFAAVVLTALALPAVLIWLAVR
jgi:hypothetical protein